jgi:hypothetical protein
MDQAPNRFTVAVQRGQQENASQINLDIGL